jgi:acyl-CoA thioesterase-2
MAPFEQPYTVTELLTLERVAADFFLGPGGDYPWGRIYGGQVVAQALRAAAATVEAPHRVHSLHAYFVLGGAVKVPILFEVDRLRDGRSFTTRRVVARQASGAILNLEASFQREEDDVDVQETDVPAAPEPDGLAADEWGAPADVLLVPREPGDPESRMWMKTQEALSDDPVEHACAIAFLSDHNAVSAVERSHPDSTGDAHKVMSASLDHSVWFHRPARADEWMLYAVRGHGLANARGLAIGTVHDRAGRHVATIAQEALIRSPRPGPG